MTLDSKGTAGNEETPEVQEGEVAAETSETETPPVEAEGVAETEEAEGEEGEGEQPKTEDKRRRAGGFQRKIEKLERENELLRMERLRAQPQQPKTAEPKDAAAQLDDYINSRLEQGFKQRDEQERNARAQAEFQKRTAEVRAANPDYDDVVLSSDAPVSEALGRALLTSEQGPAIMYQLAKNPEELARLSALPPVDVGREIGRLEAKASVVASPKKNPNAPLARKPAPAPISPVTARGQSNVKPVEQMSYEEYSAWRESQRKR